ncbi:MAG: M20 family metallopeptidase [Proteobacteria bacterium]|nr:M20 family metallopeptidase [Pseudomonadota bacterium]
MSVENAKQEVCAIIESMKDQLLNVSRTIHANPELALKETKAAALLTETIENAGLPVERGAYGLDTAFVSEFGSDEGPCVAILAEYDALPKIGHACGHNLIATAALGAGLSLAKLGDRLPGRVKLMGTPGEEGGGGKIIMDNRGAFKKVDTAMMIHPGGVNLPSMPTLASTAVEAIYHGRPAHASASPEKGINALDAMVTAYQAIAQLRQHIRYTERIHGIITDGGQAGNIVPDRAAGHFGVRAANSEDLEVLKKRVQGCFEAGALATGATLEAKWAPGSYLDLRTNRPLIDKFLRNAESLGREFLPLDGLPVGAAGSTDMGNVSYRVPSIHPMLAAAPADCTIHHPDFTAYAVSEMGEAAAIDGAKALAMTALDFFADADFRREVREQFKAEFK